jgi:hypothetical protein
LDTTPRLGVHNRAPPDRAVPRGRGEDHGLVAVFDGPARAALAAIAIREAFARLGLAIRAGLPARGSRTLADVDGEWPLFAVEH